MAKGAGSQMKKPCDCCKRYLNHLDEKNQNMTCFLRRMTGNFKHNTIVPNRFLKYFTEKLSGTIKLESPNGCLYDVQVMDRYDKMVLGHGWEAFVDVHHINENDSLLFRHIKECCFEVSIFDPDDCEKMFPCAGIKDTPSVQERSVDSVDVSSSSQHVTTKSSGSEKSGGSDKGRHGKTARMTAISSSSDVSGTGSSSESESFESDDLEIPKGTDYVMSSRSCLSEAQTERVIAFIHEIEPEVTVFVAILKKCHVQPLVPSLAITKEYAITHFPHETTNVTLQRPGTSKKWHPKFYKRKDRSVYLLRGKWLDFVRDNNVHEGDICLFLPTKDAEKFTFTVHLLRATATDCVGGTGFQRVGPDPGRSNNAEMASEDIKEEPTDHGEHAWNECLENENFGRSSHYQPPYILPARNHLSKSQRKIIVKKVRAIQSELPIYVAFMSKSSVGDPQRSMLELGSRYATAVHLPSRGQTVVLKYMRKIWKAKLAVNCGGRRYLSGGWPKFVRDNGLRVGDICLLELKKNERKLTMEVHIILREQF